MKENSSVPALCLALLGTMGTLCVSLQSVLAASLKGVFSCPLDR